MNLDEQKGLLERIAIIGAFFVAAAVLYYFKLRGVLIAYVIVVTVVMVLAILLQSGKGGGLASIGGLGGDSLLGTRSATPIAKATYVMGALFLFICMLIARLGWQSGTPNVGAIGGTPPIQAPINIDIPQEPQAPPVEDTGTD